MIHAKAAFFAFLALANTATVHAVLRGNRTPVDPSKELRTAMNKIRALKVGVDGNAKAAKQNKAEREPATDNPSTPETSAPTALPTGSPTAGPTGPPTASPTHEPTSPPTGPPAEMPSMPPTTQPTSDPAPFDAAIEVACNPDGATALTLTLAEASAKTIICDATKPSCREAVTAVKESAELQNFFACAGDLSEGAARKLFNKYATDTVLAEQLTMIASTSATLVTERPDAMNEACAAIAAMQSPAVADPCCQGSSGCTSAAASASSSPPFMTVAITSCTGDSACKNIGPNPLILDSSCTGVSACESMNENDLNPSVAGVTFVGEASCTNPGSCEGVGHRSYGNVVVLGASCVGSDTCNAAGRRSEQQTSNRFPSHIHIGPNACVGIDACKDTHSTVNHGSAGKREGSLTIGDGSCTQDRSCEKIGFNDRLGMDIIVAPGECSVAGTCRGCITAEDCDNGGAYLISNTDGACPKAAISSGGNPTGKKVDEYCIGRGSLPTETPTFFPTPLPTITRRPTSNPTILSSLTPSYLPSDTPSQVASEMPSDIPSSLPSNRPSQVPSAQPSQSSEQPSALPSTHPTDMPSVVPSSQPSQQPTRTSSPTLPPPASFTVGCLSKPGDVSSTFNGITGDLLCDGATGTCAEFVSMLDALAEGKRKMVMSIFGCNENDPPQPATLEVAQKRFNNIKNEESVTSALLAIVNEDKKLFTGSASVVTNACSDDCCSGEIPCTIGPVGGGGVMTVSSGSCHGRFACANVPPNAIMLDSCKGDSACPGVGNFSPDQPAAEVEVGFRVIGPRACVVGRSCNALGVNVFGNIRVEEGACDGASACDTIAQRDDQGSTTTDPIVASVFVGKNACKGYTACYRLHQSRNRVAGSVIIEDGACSDEYTCTQLGNSDDATNDIIIRAGVCTTAATCTDCARASLCDSPTETYVIEDPATECPDPVQSACRVV